MKFKWPVFFLLVPLLSSSQSHRIDSLKKQLSFLHDSGRVDCLNSLSIEYYVNALKETYHNVQTDTAIYFAFQARDEGRRIHYQGGVGDALQNLGEIARDRGENPTAVQYFRQSIPLFDQTHQQEKYSWANLTLGWTLFMQCKFTEAKSAYERSMLYYTSADNKEKQSMLFRLISSTYGARGYNEQALENTLQAIRITNRISDARGVISSPENLANLYKDAGEPETAIAYFRLAAQKASTNNPVRYNRLLGDIAELLFKRDSAIYYYRESHRYVTLITTDSTVRLRDQCFSNIRIGEIYLRQHKYQLAVEALKGTLLFFESGNSLNAVMKVFRDLASCYLATKNLNRAFAYTKRLAEIARQVGARPYLRDAFELYWRLYDQRGKTDSAYKYSLQYIAIKDSILNDEYRRNIALSDMKAQDEHQKIKINLLQKDQQFNQEKLSLQQQKLQSESLIRYVLFGATAVLLLIGVFTFRNFNLKRKNEKQHLEHILDFQQLENKKNALEFQQQATELEMQALRAQMNPHFIFNCLSSINRYILINKTEEASDYLTKFSRLIRMALHNSEKSYITLESELEALRLYLDLERLRFKNAFNYSITFINEIDSNAVFIPPMLIQPFAENAIWHGLMHKKGTGCLEIQLCAGDKTFTCVITDNGIGRNTAAAFKGRSEEKNKSMGFQITAGRLALLSTSEKRNADFNIEDLQDDEGNGCGTKVTLTIPYKELTEVTG